MPKEEKQEKTEMHLPPVEISVFDYEKELKRTLNKNSWLRHLLGKIKTDVRVVLDDGQEINGFFQAISFVRGRINIEIKSGVKVYYINWENVKYLEAQEQQVNKDEGEAKDRRNQQD